MSRELLFKFFEGKATLEEQHCIKRWMEESEANRQELFSERKLFDSLILLTREKKEKKKLIPILLFTLREISKVAAIVGLTLLISNFFHKIKNTEEQIAYQTIEVPAGQRINLTLPDSTKVWLNANSKLTYPVNFGSKIREVFLDGEGYFEVMDRNQQFIVKTAIGNVEVFGTKFNVTAYSSDNIFETALMEGKVKVTLNDSPTNYLYLEPHQKANYKNGHLEREDMNDFNRYLWRNGLIGFKDEPVELLFASLGDYYNKKIILQNAYIKLYKYTGKFRQSDGIEYALRVLQKDLKFNYKWDNETQTIYIQ